MKTVELRTAYCWHCDECSELNFAESVVYECSQEEKEDLFREFHDLDEWDELPEDWQQFQSVYCPEVVQCCKCGTEFMAIDELEVDEDD